MVENLQTFCILVLLALSIPIPSHLPIFPKLVGANGCKCRGRQANYL